MFTLALIQLKVTTVVEENLLSASKQVSAAAKAGAKLVALPEMFACPYQTETFPKYAEVVGGPMWQALSQMAKENDIWLVGGSIPEIDDAGNIYNTCFVFDNEGKQIGRHRKVHLFDIQIKNGQHFRESDTLTPGNDLCVVDTPFGKIGIMICFDIRFVEWARLLADAGAEMIVMPGAFNMTTGPKHWELLMRARAVDNQLFVAAVSPARDPEAGYIAYGNTMVSDSWGEVLERLDAGEETLFCEIDFDKNEKVRAQLPILSARRGDLYEVKLF